MAENMKCKRCGVEECLEWVDDYFIIKCNCKNMEKEKINIIDYISQKTQDKKTDIIVIIQSGANSELITTLNKELTTELLHAALMQSVRI